VGRGAYVATPSAGLDRYAARARLDLAAIAAVGRRLTPAHTLSHASAALVWGLPLLTPPARVHVTQPWSGNSETSPAVARHTNPLSADETTERLGLAVTTLERTAVDCAMTLGPVGGLVVADAALHRGADRDLCTELLARRGRARGVRTARAVLAVADDGAESPGESLVRLEVVRLGVVPPRTQVRVETDDGPFWTDLGWPEWRVLGEYDGVAKYTADGTAAEAVLREKRRQEAIEEAGYTVLRFTKADIAEPSRVAARLRRVLPPDAFGHPVNPYLR
jgi:very-short-patch-repair endonuclease